MLSLVCRSSCFTAAFFSYVFILEVLNLAGENESKTVLDAFFLGKALGEALTERIESTIGEFLSTVGRLQSEQQKQVQEFQVRNYLKSNELKNQIFHHMICIDEG